MIHKPPDESTTPTTAEVLVLLPLLMQPVDRQGGAIVKPKALPLIELFTFASDLAQARTDLEAQARQWFKDCDEHWWYIITEVETDRATVRADGTTVSATFSVKAIAGDAWTLYHSEHMDARDPDVVEQIETRIKPHEHGNAVLAMDTDTLDEQLSEYRKQEKKRLRGWFR